MGGEVSGPGGNALVGMLLLEHQRELVREGKEERDVVHELQIASKKVGNIFDQMDKNSKDFEKTMGDIEFGMTVYSTVSSVQGVKGATDRQAQIEKLPVAQQQIENAKWEQEMANPPDPKGVQAKLKFWLPEAEKNFHQIASPLAQEEDQKNKKSGEELKKVSEGYEKLSAKARDMTQKDQDVANEAYKIGTAFLSRQG